LWQGILWIKKSASIKIWIYNFWPFYQLIEDSSELGSIDNNTLRIAELIRISNSTISDLQKTKEEFSKYEDNQLNEQKKLHKKVNDQKEMINDLEEKLTAKVIGEAIFDAKFNDINAAFNSQIDSLTQKLNQDIVYDLQ
jgi:septal ring factor EnvC (AmiA/AmiB activator)